MGMREEPKNQAKWVDALDQKLFNAFAGRVVRKDLVKRFKAGDNIPVYVLEYLLGKYCSTTNEIEIEEGIQRVKDVISERIVRADRGELIKSNLKKRGVHKLIDLVTVAFDEKDEGGKYWAGLAAAGMDHVHITERTFRTPKYGFLSIFIATFFYGTVKASAVTPSAFRYASWKDFKGLTN